MKKLADQPTAKQENYISIQEDNEGRLYMITGEHVWSGVESLPGGEGLQLILEASMGGASEWTALSPAPLSAYEDEHGDLMTPGEMVACWERHNAPAYTDISIYPSACGPAARRLFKLPTFD